MSIQTVQRRRHLGPRDASGRGVPENPERAARWYRAAAEQGYGPAQSSLGLARLYRDGHGMPRGRVQAYKWLELAIPRLAPIPARDAWIEMRAQIGATLSTEEIAEARRLARALTPKVR